MKPSEYTKQGRRKLALVLIAVVGAASAVLSQGLLWFGNYNTGPGAVDAPIYDVDGVSLLSGPVFVAQLYAAAQGESLQPVGISRPFGVGSGAGYFVGIDEPIPGVPAGGTATVQVVAWRLSDGPTFATANHPGAHVGESLVFTVGPLSDEGPPPAPYIIGLAGLQGFSLHVVVPEPSVFALGLLGGALLALGRRWRRCRNRTKLTLSPP